MTAAFEAAKGEGLSEAKVRRPTALMIRVLRDMADGLGTHHKCRGRAAHGGRSRCLWLMQQRGMIDRNDRLTDFGRETLDKYST